MWKIELVNDNTGFLAEEISKQSVEGVAWVLQTAYSKIWEETDELKKELLSKKEPELKDLEYSQIIHIAKKEEACSTENPKGVSEHPFDKEIGMGMNHKFNQPSQQKPG